MANINSLMSSTAASSTSSLYGTRNVLSGLASGMDTESMIENSVSGYKTKITQLQQEQTKYEWKQDAYRSITDKMYDLTQKYTSFTSKTNLLSNSLFNNSISTTAIGENADMVSATGRSSSDIQILAAQAATAASYSVSADRLGLNVSNIVTNDISTDRVSTIQLGTLKGTMTLNYDGQSIDLTFDETDKDIDGNTKTLAAAINEKLGEATVNTGFGTKKASELIQADIDADGNITFAEIGTDKRGANPYVSYLGGNLKSKLGATESNLYTGSTTKKYTFSNGGFIDNSKTVAKYLSEKEIDVTVDGVTKSFALSEDDINSLGIRGALAKGIEGLGMGLKAQESGDNKLSFSAGETSNFSISVRDEETARRLGLDAGISNYLNTSSTIGNLIDNFSTLFTQAKEESQTVLNRLEPEGDYFRDNTTGNLYVQRGTDYYHVSDDENHNPLYELKINSKSIYISQDATLDSVLEGINNSDMGVKASYSKLTGNLVFTAKETGESGGVSFDNDLAKSLFGTKISSLTLGDIFDESWFTNGKMTLFTGSSSLASQGTFNATDSVDQFLKGYRATTIDFIDENGDDTLNGYKVEVLRLTSTAAYPEDITMTNASSQGPDTPSISLKEFVERVNNFGRTSGTDATVRATVNNEVVTLSRASNTIDFDGMQVTLKGSFNETSFDRDETTGELLPIKQQSTKLKPGELNSAISFNSSAGSDDLVKTITSFVDDYNAVLKQLHDAYATQPAEKNSSTHAKYDPLTDDDKSGMSEKAIESYEAKAKQGILFGDSDLRTAYEALVRAISPGGNDGAALRDMGIETTYSGGVTQIKLNESKLRDTLAKDPDSVRNAFTKSKEYGASSDGLMTSIKATMERYSSTSFANPGILVRKAGSTYSSSSLLSNAVQSQIDSVQKKIEQWQSKMSTKIDYYTRQFTALEKLMNTMNSQSSALAGLMGGY